MKILLIGGGGREHALAKAIVKNPDVETLYALPGNAGIAEIAECHPIAATDLPGIVSFARERAVDFAVVAPDDPLARGLVDRLHDAGIACFGPSQAAARIEASKVFAKELMTRAHIPTARYAVFTDEGEALAYLKTQRCPIVVKADGLALGKGVVVAERREEAEAAVREMMAGRFGDSGKRLVIEECLEGPEVSVLCFTDGHTVRPMVSSMDHKRAFDFDQGPNTGGMGVIAPNPFYTPAIADRAMREIFLPTVRAMNELGCPFKGCLYFGLMLTEDGPKVIEYNSRFGDPEAEAVLPLLESDLLTILMAVENETLSDAPVVFAPAHSATVIVASAGYPGAYPKGLPIELNDAAQYADICHCGTAMRDGRLVTDGGRVLAVTATGETLREALAWAYEGASCIRFDGVFYRSDIGRRAVAMTR